MPRPKSANAKPKTPNTSATPAGNNPTLGNSGSVSAALETKAPQGTPTATGPGPVAVPSQNREAQKTVNTPASNGKQQAHGSQVTDEQVRERAYHLFLERGGQGGNPEEDWFRAETELRRRSA